MPYVLRRKPDGAYVARPGSRSSYTRTLEHAQTFKTAQHAEQARCPDNEVIVHTDDLLTEY